MNTDQHSESAPSIPRPLTEWLSQITAMDWKAIRREFPCREGLTYLNTGSLGICPRYVIQGSLNAWMALEENPADNEFLFLIPAMEDVRAKAAAFLGCTPAELAFTQNTTDGLHLIAQGMEWHPDDRVLTTSHEHPGGTSAWKYLAKRRGVHLDRLALPVEGVSEAMVLERMEQALQPSTRVVSMSHVMYSTGTRLPIRAMARLAHEHGCLLVVDGAQSAGVFPVDVVELECDAYVTSCHKWMLAPKGTGLLYIREEIQPEVQPPPFQQGYGVYTTSTGTRNLPTILGLGAAMDFLDAVGWGRAHQRIEQLREMLFRALSDVDGVRVVSPPEGPLACALVTFALPEGVEGEPFRAELRETHRIVVRAISMGSFHSIRVSGHIYNDEGDVARLVDALRYQIP